MGIMGEIVLPPKGLFLVDLSCIMELVIMNRTKGFVNLNRFKSGRAIKKLSKASYDKRKKRGGK